MIQLTILNNFRGHGWSYDMVTYGRSEMVTDVHYIEAEYLNPTTSLTPLGPPHPYLLRSATTAARFIFFLSYFFVLYLMFLI